MRDRADKPEYKTKNRRRLRLLQPPEHRRILPQLEFPGARRRARKGGAQRLCLPDRRLSQADGQIQQERTAITFADVEDCLIIVISSFSSVTSYENQTKKAITNKGIQDAMVEMFRHNLEVYFIENPLDADKIAAQVLINKRSREDAEKTRLNLKKKLTSNMDITSRVAKFVDCRSKDVGARALHRGGRFGLGACKQARNPDFQAIIPIRGKILNCLKADYDKIFKSDIITDPSRCSAAGWRSKARPTRTSPPSTSKACAGARSSSAPTPTSTASRSALCF